MIINKKPLTDSQRVLKNVLLEELNKSYVNVDRYNDVAILASKRTGINYKRCLEGISRLTAGGKIGCENPHYPFHEV
jgi:hypothetical protein